MNEQDSSRADPPAPAFSRSTEHRVRPDAPPDDVRLIKPDLVATLEGRIMRVYGRLNVAHATAPAIRGATSYAYGGTLSRAFRPCRCSNESGSYDCSVAETWKHGVCFLSLCFSRARANRPRADPRARANPRSVPPPPPPFVGPRRPAPARLVTHWSYGRGPRRDATRQISRLAGLFVSAAPPLNRGPHQPRTWAPVTNRKTSSLQAFRWAPRLNRWPQSGLLVPTAPRLTTNKQKPRICGAFLSGRTVRVGFSKRFFGFLRSVCGPLDRLRARLPAL